MRYQGRITTWKDDKGFGFITPNGSGKHVFAHISSFSNRQRRPGGDELVTYELTVDEKGRGQAMKVAFVGEKPGSDGASVMTRLPPIFTVGFLAFLVASVLSGKLPAAILGVYLAASILAFLAYALDKSAARNNRWRTPENTLHLFGLIGGWPGALAAQKMFRHKSSKASFQGVFWATVVLNCCALGWLLTASGSAALRSVIGAT
ncbi:MAG: cold shock and DUF1294 domain-containing protein [Betaproteobacteria bacterium]|jgi:uncharacterized membrane protein YsdA (DUF1294 family)/cold shock CspA family protein|nr:cold shock and DUF1294 domain-containing protein [Betaproteobacteria bacterium]